MANRDGFVRLQVELYATRTTASAVDAAAWFLQNGSRLDAGWVAFIRKSFADS